MRRAMSSGLPVAREMDSAESHHLTGKAWNALFAEIAHSVYSWLDHGGDRRLAIMVLA
jgi:hypothetical protein